MQFSIIVMETETLFVFETRAVSSLLYLNMFICKQLLK